MRRVAPRTLPVRILLPPSGWPEPAGSLIEAKRFVLSLGRFGKALGPKELVEEMRAEVREMKKEYGAVRPDAPQDRRERSSWSR
jgi:hypothetical protein